MTVAELIAELQKMPQDLEVYTCEDFFGEPYTATYSVQVMNHAMAKYPNNPHAGEKVVAIR